MIQRDTEPRLARDQFRGCLLGLSLGDALGAPYEGGLLEKLVWRAIGKTSKGEIRWTDDTQMSVDLIESFLAKGCFDADDLATRFAANYRWSRGYGPGTARMLKLIGRGVDWRTANRAVYPDGSFGNGAAMRAPVLGLVDANELERVAGVARLTAIVTHAHPIGVEGSLLVAIVTALAAQGNTSGEVFRQAGAYCTQKEFTSRIMIAQGWLESDQAAAPSEVALRLGRGIAADKSSVTAVYLALRYRDQPFLEMQQFIAKLGGDVDTIGAMAGAIWGAINGAAGLPAEVLSKLEQRERLTSLADALYQRVSGSSR